MINQRFWILPVLVIVHSFVVFILLLFIAADAGHAEGSLQLLVDQTPENGILQLENKTYDGNITINKPISIIGKEKTVIKGDRTGNVIAVYAPNVRLENLHVTDSSHDRNEGEEYAGIKVFQNNIIIRNVTITECFHGVYLSQSHFNEVSDVHVVGRKNGEIAGQGNGLHLYYSNDNMLLNNTIDGTRDGIYFDYSNRNEAKGNKIIHTRYGLHYMYSHDNQFYENSFSYNIGGAAIMDSMRTTLKHNQFVLNQGLRSYGLLLQASDETIVSDNLFFQNQRGLYIDQAQDSLIKNNEILQNQIGVEIWSSSQGQIFTENQFSNNIATVLTLGGKDKNSWNENGRGNDWGNSIPVLDLDQNGIGDYPVQYKSSLYQLVENNELAYLFLKSPAIKIYEKMNEFLNKKEVMFTDEFPLVQKEEGLKLTSMAIIVSLLFIIVGTVFLKRRRMQ